MTLVTFLHVIIESGFAMFCLLAVLSIRMYDSEERKSTKAIIACLITNTVINIADAAAYVYRGDSTEIGYYMVRISNFAVFTGMFVLLAFGNRLLDSLLEERNAGADKRPFKAVLGICASGVALVTLSAFLRFFYSFDDQNFYHRGVLYPVIPVLAAAAVVILIIRTFNEKDSLPQKEYHALMCIWLLPVFGMAAQVLYYGISLANICNSLAVIIMTLVYIREIIDSISVRKSFILNGESVERISEELDGFLKGIGTERQNRIRVRFTVEEALLSIWQRFGDYNMVKVIASIRFGKPSIRIEHVGSAYNPFSKTKSSVEEWSRGLLASAGLSPTYSYTRGTNIMKIPMRRLSINPVIVVVFAIILGIISGSVALVTLSEVDAAFVNNGLLMPVYDLWNNMLNSVSAPAMLVIVMSTMLNTREVSEQGGSAGAITGRYFFISLVLGVITIVAAVLMSGHGFAYNGYSRDTLVEMIRGLFSIVPENILDPIKDFNTAQLIPMGIIFAYATMAVGQPAAGIATLIQQLNLVSMQLAQWIAVLMPVFTVFLTAQLVISHNAQLLTSLLVVIPFSFVVSVLVMIAVLMFVSKRFDAGPGVLLKKLWPAFILTLEAGLDSDSYALSEKICIKGFGIQKIYTQRVLPLGLVLYMPSSVIGMLSFVVFAAIYSGVEITPLWILEAIIFALILLVAAPPIPGVNLLSYVVIIGELGIGKEFVIAAMIFDILFNAFGSAANQMLLHLDMVLQAEHMGILNQSVLRSDNAAESITK